MKKNINITIEHSDSDAKKIKRIAKVLDFCLNEYSEKFRLNILITDNKRIREINNLHRQTDSTTDVLSFPMLHNLDGKLVYENYDFDLGLLFLGDIVISIERTKEQAISYGHTFEREAAFLLTHGMLHLLGYDHDNPIRENLMREKQEAILVKAGYIR